MDRLTEPKGSEAVRKRTHSEIVECLTKLQAYEDTELSPREVNELKQKLKNERKQSVLERERCAALAELTPECTPYYCITILKEKIYKLEHRIEELEGQLAYECGCNQQLVNLQKENKELKKRLENNIDVPYKVGDIVWCVVKEKPQDLTKTADEQPQEYFIICKGEVRNIILNDIDHKIYIHIKERYANMSYSLKSASKHIFATKEQAEERLKELRDEYK